MTATTTPRTDLTADAFAERLLGSALGAMEMFSVFAGDRLGWYRSLAADGPATSAELAERTGTSERYAREWLEQQAVGGILATDAGQPGEVRRYELPAGAAEVLTDPSSLAFMGPVGRMIAASMMRAPELLGAYRTGGGVSWDQLGDDARFGQADMNRPWFESQLPGAFAGLAEIHTVLSAPKARVAEVGFGGGWASIAMARAYPGLHIDGYDVDAPSVELAQRNAEASGVADRVSFHHSDGAGIGAQGSFDAAFAFECIHDMPQPVPVLEAMRQAVKPGAPVVVMDEAVAEQFTAPGDELERLMYGFSLMVCLPDGMSSTPSVGTGTVMRPSTLDSYARQAGFVRTEILPIDDFGFWRFYRLHADD
jgi:SAM-dependent methyltransferase